MSLLDPRVWLGVALLMLASYLGGRAQQSVIDDKATAVAAAHAQAVATETEKRWNIAAQAAEEVHDEEVAAIAAARDAAIAGLRNRPGTRMPSTAACAGDQGATGAQLSGPDAAVLVGIAADADKVAADLRECLARWPR